MYLNINVPEHLSRKLTILKGQLGLGNKQEVLLYILDKFVLDDNSTPDILDNSSGFILEEQDDNTI